MTLRDLYCFPQFRTLLSSVVGALLMVQSAAFSQPFSEPLSFGGGPEHDIVLDGVRYRISLEETTVSRVDEKTGEASVTQPLPSTPGFAQIRGLLKRNELFLFYNKGDSHNHFDDRSVLVSLNRETLKENWHQDFPNFSEKLYVQGDSLYLASNRTIEKVDLTDGKKLWIQTGVKEPGWMFPRIDGDEITFSALEDSWGNKMDIVTRGFATLDTTTGQILKRQPSVFKPTLFSWVPWPYNLNTKSYFGCHHLGWTEKYLMFTPKGAVTLWEVGQGTPLAEAQLRLRPQETIDTAYVGYHDDRVYVFYLGNQGLGHLSCLRRDTLQPLWHHSVSGNRFASPGNIGPLSAVIAVDNLVQNVDLKTGEILWETKDLPVKIDGSSELLALGPPILSGSELIFPEALSFLSRPDQELVSVVDFGRIVLDLESGKVLERHPSKLERSIAR